MTDSPEDEWAKIEMEILKDRLDLLDGLGKPDGLPLAFEHLRAELGTTLERWARALARLFTIGGLGAFAKQNMTYVTDFLMLRDDQLGRRSW